MAFNFENSKNVFLSKKDKSDKQSWDEKIAKLCKEINNKKNYFTTSSCSGRIVLIIEENKKKPNLFLFRTHDKIKFSELKKELRKICKDNYNNRKNLKNKLRNKINLKNKTIYFKQEPCILVVSCRNKESQWKLFNLTRNNGWKKSGILTLDKKFLIELMSTENISFPVCNKSRVLVDDDFLKIIVKKANNNLERGWGKIERLKKLILLIR